VARAGFHEIKYDGFLRIARRDAAGAFDLLELDWLAGRTMVERPQRLRERS